MKVKNNVVTPSLVPVVGSFLLFLNRTFLVGTTACFCGFVRCKIKP